MEVRGEERGVRKDKGVVFDGGGWWVVGLG
jgi:hypothetical protein